MNLRALIDETRSELVGTDESFDAQLSDLADLVEEAGYDVPEEMDAHSFLLAVEAVLEDDELDEKFGQKIKAAFGKVKKGVKHGLHKARAAINRAKPPSFMKYQRYGHESFDDLNDLADVVEEAGFEIPEDVSPEVFLGLVERDVLEAEIDEALGQKIKHAYHRAKHSIHKFMKAQQYAHTHRMANPHHYSDADRAANR